MACSNGVRESIAQLDCLRKFYPPPFAYPDITDANVQFQSVEIEVSVLGALHDLQLPDTFN